MTFLKKQGAAFYFNAVAIVLAVAGIVRANGISLAAR